MAPLSALHVVILVSVAMGSVGAFLAWRERPEPGATPLAVMMAAQSLWSALYFFEIQASTLGAKLFWSNAEWVGVVVIPVAWVVFTFEYTGHDGYVRPRYIAALSVVPAVTLLFVVVDAVAGVGLMFQGATLQETNGAVIPEQTRGPWFWVITLYTYLLAAVGSLLVIQLVRSKSSTFRGQSTALLLGVSAPWLSNALFLSEAVPIEGLDPTPIAFSVSGIAYLGALTQFRLLGTSPAPNRRARRLVFERMRDGAVVVDGHDYVVDVNESAAAVLGSTPSAALGRPAAEVVPGYEDLPEEGETSGNVTIYEEQSGRPYDVTVTHIEDFHGRAIGRIIAFHDVSEHVRHQQRLEVLNRVLRHNIRNETNVIYGYADLLAGTGEAGSDHAAIVKERAMNIADMGEKARQIVDVFERVREEPQRVPLAELVAESVADTRGQFPAVEIEVGSVPEDAYVNGLVEPALSNLVENAAEHNSDPDPHVEVTVGRTYGVPPEAGVGSGAEADVETEGEAEREERLRIVVADNGPGIGVYEQSVLERGTETALEHGSGLGLWLVTWAVGIADGHVGIEANEPTGTVVTVDVPALGEHDRCDGAVPADSADEGTDDGTTTRSEASGSAPDASSLDD